MSGGKINCNGTIGGLGKCRKKITTNYHLRNGVAAVLAIGIGVTGGLVSPAAQAAPEESTLVAGDVAAEEMPAEDLAALETAHGDTRIGTELGGGVTPLWVDISHSQMTGNLRRGLVIILLTELTHFVQKTPLVHISRPSRHLMQLFLNWAVRDEKGPVAVDTVEMPEQKTYNVHPKDTRPRGHWIGVSGMSETWSRYVDPAANSKALGAHGVILSLISRSIPMR